MEKKRKMNAEIKANSPTFYAVARLKSRGAAYRGRFAKITLTNAGPLNRPKREKRRVQWSNINVPLQVTGERESN